MSKFRRGNLVRHPLGCQKLVKAPCRSQVELLGCCGKIFQGSSQPGYGIFCQVFHRGFGRGQVINIQNLRKKCRALLYERAVFGLRDKATLSRYADIACGMVGEVVFLAIIQVFKKMSYCF